MSTAPTFDEPPPGALLEYLRSGVHTGRGTGHLNAITDCIVPGLAAHPLLAPIVAAGELTYFAGARQGVRGLDLVLGRPGAGTAVFDSVVGMYAGMPETVQIVGRYTSIMTEHAKAQRNRAEDFLRFADKTARKHNTEVVRFGVCPVNASTTYYSHTAKGSNDHGNGQAKAARAIDILRSEVNIRTEPNRAGLDSMWTPVVVTNNALEDADRQVDWLRTYPQPADGEPFSYSWFIDSIARAFVERFGS
jgi:hypothetical protein